MCDLLRLQILGSADAVGLALSMLMTSRASMSVRVNLRYVRIMPRICRICFALGFMPCDVTKDWE